MTDKTEVTEEAPVEPEPSSGRGAAAIMGPIAAAFFILTVAAVVAAYQFGEGVVYINDRTISDLHFLEVTGGAALGVLGAVAGVSAATVGAIGAVAATIVGVTVGTLGVALGAVVMVGVVTGPILLIGIIAWAIKRRYWPDVI